jgi:O-methyltransferase
MNIAQLQRAVVMAKSWIKIVGKNVVNRVIATPSTRATTMGRGVRYVVDRVGAELSAAKYEDMFLRNGETSKFDRQVRASILKRFRRIDQEMNIKTTPTDGLFLAEALLTIECDGAVVECGCFNGGSTAKLSILAKLTGRQMFIFDSFEGLPEADAYNTYDLHARRSSEWAKERHWKVGEYAAALDAVKANIEKWGEASVCTFIKGWFNETLENGLPPQISFAFTDVDLPTSARECLLHIWPRLADGGVFFSHDVAYIKVLQAFNDKHLWEEIFKEHQPIFLERDTDYVIPRLTWDLLSKVKSRPITLKV